jgi:hypothetical protein
MNERYNNMFDSKDIARRALQRASQIKEEKARRRNFSVTIAAVFCICASLFIAERTLFTSITENDGDHVIISDVEIPLGNAAMLDKDKCPECDSELIEDECEECEEA